ncbi:MAG: hypothetical protein EBZ48_10155 [Proteobacteria bacterium]|nr:hypothetical protein [Pseudomonadota bacterium]
MTRVSFSQLSRNAVNNVFDNYADVLKYSNQLSSGYKAVNPGDSDQAGLISQAHGILDKIEAYSTRTTNAKAVLRFQDDTINSAVDLVSRALDLASQGANEAINGNQRATIAIEVFQIRDQLMTMANSKYQGNYVWSGADTTTAPFSAATYANYGSTASQQRYIYQSNGGAQTVNSAQVADGVTISTNTPGDTVWGGILSAVERLGRALEGYPTGSGGAAPAGNPQYALPADYPLQTKDIGDALQAVKDARDSGLFRERTSLGARLNRIDTAGSVLNAAKTSAQLTLDNLQNADTATAATGLQQAQYGLQAAMQVTAKVLNLNVLDYL